MHGIVKIQCATPYDKNKTDISYIHEKENGHYITFPEYFDTRTHIVKLT